MTRNDKVKDETPDVVSIPDDWEFETVEDTFPTGIVFDTIGDQFVGQYNGTETIDQGKSKESFERFVFMGRDGKYYAVSKSRKLNYAMSNVSVGQWVRITYVGDFPSTSNDRNPMKDFTVEVRK